MPRKQTKKPAVKQTKQEDVFENDVPSIFDHFGLGQNPGGGTGGTKAKKEVPEKDERDDKIAELMKRMDDLQRTNVALMAQPNTSVQVPTAPKELDLSGLPDPVADPDRYAVELNKRISENMNARASFTQSTLTVQQENQRKLDALWGDFNGQYEEIAENEDRVKFIAGQLIDEAKNRGLDPQKYIFSGRDQFFGDIKSRYEKVFGKPGAVVEDDNDEDDVVAEDTGRSTSIIGGIESGFQSGSKTGKQEREQLGSLEKDISDIQRKSGFY